MISRALEMAHAEDPAVAIRRAVTTPRADGIIPLDGIRVGGQDLLVGVYKPDDVTKTSGGIILPAKSRDEYDYQGVTGLVLKMGPLAFKTDKTQGWFVDDDDEPFPPKIGDWVIFDVKTSHPQYLAGQYCRFVQAEFIYGVVAAPDLVA